MFGLVILQKFFDFEIYVGQMHFDGKMYCICWSEEVMYSSFYAECSSVL